MTTMEAQKKQYDYLLENYICVSDLVHGYRVASLALKICEMIGLDEKQKQNILLSGVFHDIGKSAIDLAILNKPDKLTPRERDRIKYHVVLGAQIADDANFSKECIEIINSHHESWDGTGYPVGMRGSDIPIGARIIKVCDIYDALISDRPYRKRFSELEALSIMAKEIDTIDPMLFQALKEVIW